MLSIHGTFKHQQPFDGAKPYQSPEEVSSFQPTSQDGGRIPHKEKSKERSADRAFASAAIRGQ